MSDFAPALARVAALGSYFFRFGRTNLELRAINA
jgi:hypothetical protein